MFIGCEKVSGYSDRYYIEGAQTLEELQEYIKKEMPVMGRKIERRHLNSAVLEYDTYITLIYLNNYTNIYEATLHFIDIEDLEKIQNDRCKVYKNYDNMFGCTERYKPDEIDGCANYVEPKTEIKKKWLRFWRS